MKINDSIGCRFCDWHTRKRGRGQTLDKAFTRLRTHIQGTHPEEADALQQAGEATDLHTAEIVGTFPQF